MASLQLPRSQRGLRASPCARPLLAQPLTYALGSYRCPCGQVGFTHVWPLGFEWDLTWAPSRS